METKETSEISHSQESQAEEFSETLDVNERRIQEADARLQKAKGIVLNQSGVVMTKSEVADSDKNPDAYRVENR